MNIFEKIIETEIAYSRCFCENTETEIYYKFKDDKLEEMYCHNYLFMKKEVSSGELRNLIEEEIKSRKLQKKTFFQIDIHFEPDKKMLSQLAIAPQVTLMEYYVVQAGELKRQMRRQDCEIVKMETEQQIEQAEEFEIAVGEKYMGVDFSRERFKRRMDIYMEPEKVEHYLCYIEKEIVGHADFFNYDKLVKIEDFEIESAYQRQGIGSAMIHRFMELMIERKGQWLYVATEIEDTAKEMYQKCGLTPCGKRYSLFFDLNEG